MKKNLGQVLLGIVLGCASLEAGAQQCAPGGQVTSAGPGVMGGFCYYGDGSCITHPAGNIPSSCLKSPPPPLPDKWGAVAWNLNTGVYDTSTGERSEAEAVKVALQKCGAGCEVFTSYANQCVAAAGGYLPDGYVQRRIRLDTQRVGAEKKALNECSKEAKSCQIIFSECSLPN